MTESQQLLAEYVGTGSEKAFQELVARYVDLVYSAALRLVEGDAHRARDVAQTVFADLARMAPRLSPHSLLGGWLHRRACFVARTVMRGERRRQARERQAVEMSALENQADAALAEIAPVLDEAINELGADDREVILLRFFEQRSLRSVGDALGTSENVAQKRVARAVEELSFLLKRRGFRLSVAALASGLAAGAVKAAPAGLALALAKGALTLSGASTSFTAASANTVVLTKAKIIAGVLVMAGIVTILWLQHVNRPQRSGQTEVPTSQVAEQTVANPEPLSASDDRSASLASEASPPPGSLPAETRAVATEPSDATPVAAIEDRPALPRTFSGGLYRRFFSQPGSRLRIEGTNNATRQPWQAESTILEGFWDSEIGPAGLTRGNPGPVPVRAAVAVPIRSIRTVDDQGRPFSDRIDAAWYAALKARDDTNARAAFYLSALSRVNSGSRMVPSFEARGDLVIVGITNSITLPVRIASLSGDRFEILGKTSIRWVSEAVDPFSVAMDRGHFSPDSKVTLKFEWLLGPTNATIAAAPEGLVPLHLDLPAPRFKWPPREVQFGAYVEPLSEMPRALMLVPPGVTNLARNVTVRSSDRNATRQALEKIVDGNKEADDQNIVYLRKGTQWVQLDLAGPREIFAVVLWHAHNGPKVYHDVVVQAADDPDFHQNVRTLFNNDQDNTSGLGKGEDLEYFETHEGKLIDAHGVRARFLRFYSRGSTESALNEYTEIEVYGRRME